MRVTFMPGARAQLRAIYDDLAKDNEAAARAIIARAEEIARLLGDNPRIGRKLPHSRLRRFPLKPYPYLIYYEVVGRLVRIIRVRHAMRRHPTFHEPAPPFAR